MISLSTLSYGQFKLLCEEIGMSKVLEFAKKINLMGGQTKKGKKEKRPDLLFVYKKAYSSSLNNFVNDELKRIGYMGKFYEEA